MISTKIWKVEKLNLRKVMYNIKTCVKALEIIDYTVSEDITCLILTINFEKCFDKLEWAFIFKTLHYYNFE